MRWALAFLTGAATLAAPFSWADTPPEAAHAAQVVFLGEVHDNPAHHARQADWVQALQPTALVFEMIGQEQSVPDAIRGDAVALAAHLEWDARGWPDFGMYYPIIAAAPKAHVYGAAVPRAQARALMEMPLDAVFGAAADVFGLGTGLPEDEQASREALQQVAHCNAMPADMLPVMVDIQRLRDATLAQVAQDALARHGPPVVVITGNGHARTDWGAPAALKHAAPDVAIFALGQAEDGRGPDGTFDQIADAPGVERPDPCAALR